MKLIETCGCDTIETPIVKVQTAHRGSDPILRVWYPGDEQQNTPEELYLDNQPPCSVCFEFVTYTIEEN